MKKVLLISLAYIFTGCVTPSNEASFKKVEPKQRVYVGNISVTMNGQQPSKCELYMNSNLVSNIKLSRDGYLVYKTSDRKPLLAKLRCLHQVTTRKSAWHTQSLNLEPLKRMKKRKSINYFGHLELNWSINPKLSMAAPVENSGDFKQVGMVSNSGEIKINVKDMSEETTRYIQKKWAVLKAFRVETHLAKTIATDEDEELEDEEYED